MDLEEELSLFQQENDAPMELEQQEKTNEGGENDDLLGLDQTIKLSARSKVAKIDNERIFNKQKGLNYIIQNHPKLIRVCQKNDRNLRKRISSNKSAMNSKSLKLLKHENEYNNLSSILQFYQLWCHGLFPKAKFKDCLYLLRSFGAKSSQLKLYRRELIDQELHKLKATKGIIDLGQQENEQIELDQQAPQLSDTHIEPEQNVDDDDWGFMNVNKSNGLFVGEDDDLYHNPSISIPDADSLATSDITGLGSDRPKTGDNSKPTHINSDDDLFSDEDLSINDNSIPTVPEYPDHEIVNGDNDDDDHENEMEIMREMGL